MHVSDGGQDGVAVLVPRHVQLLTQGIQLQPDIAVAGEGNLSWVRATPRPLAETGVQARVRVKARARPAHEQFESHVLAEDACIVLVLEAQQLG